MKPGTRKLYSRRRRALRVRKSLKGTADCPRMSVHRSLRNISVQFVDDEQGRTLAAISTLSPDFRQKHSGGGATVAAAELLGTMAGEAAGGLKIEKVIFDRGSYRYHGRVKAVAEGARKAGLQF
jgi:large subunit ribosomal protein L18